MTAAPLPDGFVGRWRAAFFFGLASALFAHSLGIPWWTEYVPGDASDIGVLVFFGVRSIAYRKEPSGEQA